MNFQTYERCASIELNSSQLLRIETPKDKRNPRKKLRERLRFSQSQFQQNYLSNSLPTETNYPKLETLCKVKRQELQNDWRNSWIEYTKIMEIIKVRRQEWYWMSMEADSGGAGQTPNYWEKFKTYPVQSFSWYFIMCFGGGGGTGTVNVFHFYPARIHSPTSTTSCHCLQLCTRGLGSSGSFIDLTMPLLFDYNWYRRCNSAIIGSGLVVVNE